MFKGGSIRYSEYFMWDRIPEDTVYKKRIPMIGIEPVIFPFVGLRIPMMPVIMGLRIPMMGIEPVIVFLHGFKNSHD